LDLVRARAIPALAAALGLPAAADCTALDGTYRYESTARPHAESETLGRLARSFEHLAGLGDAIRTERVEEALERDGAGNLVHRQSIKVAEGPGRSRVVEARFAPAPAEPAR
jgi:hypothetical protein